MSTQLLTPGKCSAIALLGGVGLTVVASTMGGSAVISAVGGILTWLAGVAGNQVQSWLGSKLKNPPPNADEVFHNHHIRQLLSQALISTVEKLVPLAKEKLGGVSQTLIDSGKTLAKRLGDLMESPSGTLAVVREFNVTAILTEYATKQGHVELLSAQEWQQFIDEEHALKDLPPAEHEMLVSALHLKFGEALWGLVKHAAAANPQAFAALELLYLSQILETAQSLAGTPPDLSPIITRIGQLLGEIDQKHVAYFQSILSGIIVLAGKFDAFFNTYRKDQRKNEAFQTKTTSALDELLKRQPINQYRRNLLARFSKHNSIGIPAVEDTKQRQGPDPIQLLFVHPTCSAVPLRAEDLPSASKDEKRRPTPLLSRLTTEKRIVLLADPGMGKSTLIQWLVVTLADNAVPSPEAVTLGRGIPLPIILRDIVPLMPLKLEDWTWKALISCFLKYRLDETQLGMAQPLNQDEDTLREVMQSPHAWFLIDGLDEVGDKQKRTALREAIWQGFDAHPEARFLVTSRIVGYEEAEIDPLLDSILLTEALTTDAHLYRSVFKCLNEAGLITIHDDNTADITSLVDAARVLQTQGPEVGNHFGRAIGASFVDRATRLYLSPWNIEQQSAFAHNWFGLRLGDHDGPIRARDFVRAVHDHPSTCAIGRVPNLLLLMALLYRYRADLPHGRAKVYAGISQAYLENIAQVCRIDHRSRTSIPYTFSQKERLLSLLAMHLQLRRYAEDEQRSENPTAETESEILASKDDLHRWLCAEFGQASDEANRHEMDKFIDHIADSSGLLLPRGVKDGQEQFAFAHLSFQEYYAACWLELEFSRLLNLHAGDDDDLLVTPPPSPDAELAMTEALFAKRATFTAWREPILFLAEKLSERPSDTLTLRKWLFPIRKGETLPMPAQQLLATLSIDPQVSFTSEQRQAIWDHLCRAHLANAHAWRESVTAFLLVPSDYQPTILSRLANIAAETKRTSLYLTGCTGVRNLVVLKDLSSLKILYLTGCTGLSDLAVLKDLGNLKILSLNDCTGLSDLAALKDLDRLQALSLHGCTGVSDLSALQGLGNLMGLDLTGCTGVSHLAALQDLGSLEWLYLKGCTGVSDLAALQGLSSLKALSLIGCAGVKDRERQIAALKKALPKCDIQS